MKVQIKSTKRPDKQKDHKRADAKYTEFDSDMKKKNRTTAQAAREVVKDAVKQATRNFSEHFEKDGDVWKLNEKNPPSQDDGYQAAKDLIGMDHAAQWMKNERSWMMGNLVAEMRRIYGDALDKKEMERITGLKWRTLQRAENCYLHFKNCRVKTLSFSTHREVLECAAFNTKLKEQIIKKARDLNLSSTQTRMLCVQISKGNMKPLQLKEKSSVLKELTRAESMRAIFLIISYDGKIKKVRQRKLTKELQKDSRVIVQLTPEEKLIKMDIESHQT